jgi:hypothetical protein
MSSLKNSMLSFLELKEDNSEVFDRRVPLSPDVEGQILWSVRSRICYLIGLRTEQV